MSIELMLFGPSEKLLLEGGTRKDNAPNRHLQQQGAPYVLVRSYMKPPASCLGLEAVGARARCMSDMVSLRLIKRTVADGSKHLMKPSLALERHAS